MDLCPHPIRAIINLVERDAGMIWGLALAFAVRLVLLPWFSDPVNFYGIHLTASFVEQGGNPWRLITSDPALAVLNPWGYPPLYLVPAVLATLLSFGNGYAFGIWIKAPLIVADLASGILLFRTARSLGLGLSKARAVSYGYLFNPFSVLVCAIWGTNDPLVVAATVAAIYFSIRRPSDLRLSSLFLGIGIAFKLYPVIFLPLFLAGLSSWRSRLRYAAIALGIPLVTAAPVLLTSPFELMRTLGSFSTGVGPGGFDPSQSFWWLLADIGVPVGTGTVLAASALFLLVLVVLARWVATRRMTFVRAATVAILGLFIVAPRLNQNYFLWAIPLIVLAACAEPWRSWGRRLAFWSWVPFVATTLAYNGAGGVVGLAYWTLISVGRPGPTGFSLPRWALPIFLSVWVAILTVAIGSLMAGPVKAARAPATSARWTPRRPYAATKQAIAVVVVTAFVVFAVGSVAVGIAHHPVLPEDFGSYRVTPTEVGLGDEFRALLFGFEWRPGGSGIADLSPGRTPPLVLDTLTVNGTSWIERQVPDGDVRFSLSLVAVEVDHVPGTLILAQFPAGLLVVETAANQTHNLSYVDSVRNQTTRLGLISLGTEVDVIVLVSHAQTEVDFAALRLLASGQDPIDRVRIGHTLPTADGGGRIAVQRVSISWPTPDGAYAPLIGPATVLIGLAVLASPVEVYRRLYSGKT